MNTMYSTNVSELCSAVQNIEKRDLARVLKKMGGAYIFPSSKEYYVECYSNGPCSAPVMKVMLNGDNVKLSLGGDVGGVIDSVFVYPGHLSGITNAIIENVKARANS